MPAAPDPDHAPDSANQLSNAGPGPNVPPEVVTAERRGQILLQRTILKSDYFPGCQNRRLRPLIDGAPNYRQVPNLPVYGVAIPTHWGMREVLDIMGATKGKRKVYWHNMREEPVIYVNGRPYVVREADAPLSNLEYTGITRARVEAMEARLKQDVVQEAAKYESHILLAHEGDDFQLIEIWEPTTEYDVQTPLEVYQELLEDGYDIEYVRVPVTDEKAPKDNDVDLLVQRVWRIAQEDEARIAQGQEPSAIVFNCQMGRGRTTTGMIIASMVLLRKHIRSNPDVLPPWFNLQELMVSPRSPSTMTDEEAALKDGQFGVVRSLLRVLDHGQASKAIVDAVIDSCSAMQNLREAIATYRSRLLKESNDSKREALLQVVVEYLERYYVLIAFSEYLMGPHFDPSSTQHLPFASWTASRPEMQSILRRMLRRNPLAAINLHRPQQPADGMLPRAASSRQDDDATERQQAALDLCVAQRQGAVLGPHTILKGDHFPGCHSSKLAQLVAGAPNLREVGGMHVWGMAFPTADGLRGAMRHIGVQSTFYTPLGDRRAAVWINMREEPVLYINGQPYVLREAERPFKNLQEYRGIGAERLELMEQRLKEDVLREAEAFHGRVLVSREEPLPGSNVTVVTEVHEVVQGPAAVMTAREMAVALVTEGYLLTYHRVPLTDDMAPRASDFDAFYKVLRHADPDAPVVFNCQMGVGRTTTGMVVACMLRNHLHGVPLTGRLLRSFSEAEPTAGDALDGLSPRMVSGQSDDDEDDHSPRGMDRMDSEEVLARLTGSASLHDGPTSRATSLELALEDEQSARMRQGEYVGVRRFVRVLEYGDEAKDALDRTVNACSAVINLRTAIMRYRTPRNNHRFYRPEINARSTAYKRGIAYLERYCLLIAFQAYLAIDTTPGRHAKSFQEWYDARPDVKRAMAAISQNPTVALAPMPAPPPVKQIMHPETPSNADRALSDRRIHTTKSVLTKRRGGTLSQRSILKSYLVPPSRYNAIDVPGVTDIRKAKNWPVYTVSSCTVPALRNLLQALGGGPGGASHVVVTDLREELVVYVNGTPYMRRDLEMPAASMHHAGIRAYKLEELERRLLADVAAEAQVWDGRILLHRESRGSVDGQAAAHDEEHDDVTKQVDMPVPLVAYWEAAGSEGDPEGGLSTAQQVFERFASEGFSLSYRRIPLSRERTPEAADLEALWAQSRAAPSLEGCVHVVLARTSTGSSCRFAAAFFAMSMAAEAPRAASSGAPEAAPSSPDDRAPLDKARALRGEYRAIMNLCRVLPNGIVGKGEVDDAIDLCAAIGNLREDVYRCKVIVERPLAEEEAPTRLLEVSAARQQGMHYLQRYFYLIAFRLYQAMGAEVPFSKWFGDRAELKHLLSTLSLR